MKLDDKVALVTGGSSGIGDAAARRLAREGASVVILARSKDRLEETAEAIEEQGGSVLPLAADVSDPAAIEGVIQETVDHFGKLNIVLANAGINGKWAPIEELEVEDWNTTIGINLSGTFHTIKFAVPHLKEAGGGSIVVTSSINGTRTFSLSGATAYATSKAGQLAMAKMLALELAPSNIRVNVICPGQIATEIEESTQREHLEHVRYPADYPEGKVPLTRGEPGTPKQVADLVLFLASDESSLITGTPVWIDGAQSLFMG